MGLGNGPGPSGCAGLDGTYEPCHRRQLDGPGTSTLGPVNGLGSASDGVALIAPRLCSSHISFHPHTHSFPTVNGDLCQSVELSSNNEGLPASHQESDHPTRLAGGLQHNLLNTSTPTTSSYRLGSPGPRSSSGPPHCRHMAQGHMGHIRTRSGPALRPTETSHLRQGARATEIRYPDDSQPQDGAAWKGCSSIEIGDNQHPIPPVLVGTGRSTGSTPPVPRVHQPPTGGAALPGVCSPQPDQGLVVLCQNCRLQPIGRTSPHTPGAVCRGPRQSADHRALLEEHCNLITAGQCENGWCHSPQMSNPGAEEGEHEDFCLLPAIFAKWYAHLPAHLPSPIVDTWASSTQHCLPAYGVDYFATHYPNIPLWLNPRFSFMTAVIQHMAQHHQLGFILYPHWDTTDWWDTLQAMVSDVTSYDAGSHLFRGVHQTHTKPCPWAFSIGFVDFRRHPAPHTPLQRYYRLISSAGYPPVPPGYGAPRLPKCFRESCPPVISRSRGLSLAPITPTTMDYGQLLAMAHAIHCPRVRILHHIVQTFTDPDTFFQLFTVGPVLPGPGLPSRLTQDTLTKAVAWGLLDKHVAPYLYHPSFLVPKSTPGDGRLVTNCKDTINCLIRKIPWPCEPARRDHLLNTILSWDVASLYDFISFFFQFTLGCRIQPWFGLRQKGFKAVMTRPPQGFSPMPAAAQCVTDAVLWDMPALGHIDNIVIGGHTPEDLAIAKATFLQRCDACHLALKERDPPVETLFQHLGLQFDLQNKHYRLIPEWAAKTAALLVEICDLASTPLQLPLRLLWTALGCIFWSCYILDIILAGYWATMQFTRRTAARTSRDKILWDSPASLPPSVITEWRDIRLIIGRNEWRLPPSMPMDLQSCHSILACDSCGEGAGLCAEPFGTPYRVTHHSISWWPWPEKTQKLSMPCLEGLACIRSSEEVLPHLEEPVLWLEDCAPFLKALKKGFSPAPALNAIVRAIRSLPHNIRWQWVPTHLMPADHLSRRHGYGPLQSVNGTFLTTQLRAWLSSTEAQRFQYGPTTHHDKLAMQKWGSPCA